MLDDPGVAAGYAVAFRLVERVAISAVVVLVALIVSVAFWRSLQRVDFQISRDKLSGGGTFVLATPVFALLALICFAWVSFSNPISVAVPQGGRPGPAGDGAAVATAPGGTVAFTGAAGGAATPVGDAAYRRSQAMELVRSVNCLAERAGDLSDRDRDALVRLRLLVMQPVWQDEWGAFAGFSDWAEGRGGAEPEPAARLFFEQVHPLC